MRSETKIWCREPIVLAAIFAVFINDQFLKHSSWAGLITGKISDFAGLFFFPFFLCDVICLHKFFITLRREVFLLSAVATGFSFSAIKLHENSRVLLKKIYAYFSIPCHVVADKYDLFALLSIPLAWVLFCKKDKTKLVATALILILTAGEAFASKDSTKKKTKEKKLPTNSVQIRAGVSGQAPGDDTRLRQLLATIPGKQDKPWNKTTDIKYSKINSSDPMKQTLANYSVTLGEYRSDFKYRYNQGNIRITNSVLFLAFSGGVLQRFPDLPMSASVDLGLAGYRSTTTLSAKTGSIRYKKNDAWEPFGNLSGNFHLNEKFAVTLSASRYGWKSGWGGFHIGTAMSF